MSDQSESLKKIYAENKKFVIIGLTGRTGSGCSSTAKILTKRASITANSSTIYTSNNEKKKLEIVNNYIVKNWEPFLCIEVKSIITAKILELNFEDLIIFISKIINKESSEIKEKLKDFESKYLTLFNEFNMYRKLSDKEEETKKQKKTLSYDLYFDKLPSFTKIFKEYLFTIDIDAYTKLYQAAGDNIRASGTAFKIEFDPNKIFTIPKILNKLIKVVKYRNEEMEKNTLIVIDAIRNPYEAIYFQQRYSNFYLISINTPNEERIKHLRDSHKFSQKQIEALDNKEYPKKLKGKDIYISQNIQKCIEISDIHFNNPDRSPHNKQELNSQVNWYLSLIFHPGLITPTQIERCMQIAYSAKLNSGCISRQVGAVVTDENFSIKSVGWNSVPEGQTPCNLRSIQDITLNEAKKPIYSNYELSNSNFKTIMNDSFPLSVTNHKNLEGRNVSYCFKDIQNKIEGEKNQVHTRSLHAEENAFLQIAKYGGEAIEGGVLFSTASPCELCSKKAYQLGIKKAIYIDPYPGISKEHILNNGLKEIELILFRGALGNAHHKLYEPLMSYKDEIQILTDFKIVGKKEEDQKTKIESMEEVIKNLKEENKKLREKFPQKKPIKLYFFREYR